MPKLPEGVVITRLNPKPNLRHAPPMFDEPMSVGFIAQASDVHAVKALAAKRGMSAAAVYRRGIQLALAEGYRWERARDERAANQNGGGPDAIA